MRRLILWLDRLDFEDILFGVAFPVLLVTLFSFLLGGLGLAAARCWCDPLKQNGPVVSSWAVVAVAGYAGLVVVHNWDRLVAWAEHPPRIAPTPSGDEFEE